MKTVYHHITILNAYFIQVMMLDGACRANSGTTTELWIAVPLASINALENKRTIQYNVVNIMKQRTLQNHL